MSQINENECCDVEMNNNNNNNNDIEDEIIINSNNNNNEDNNKPNNNDANVKKHKELFEKWLNEKYSKDSTSFVLKRFDIQRIYDILKGNISVKDASERFQIKKKKYCLMENGKVGRIIDNQTKEVIALEDTFDSIYEIHCIKRLHQGNLISKFINIFLIIFIS
jgi:hypothetical protein